MDMTEPELADFYRDYIACLNAQDWPHLAQFVAHDVVHNGRTFGLAGYRALLESDFREIPDLRFEVALATCDRSSIAARLQFDCTPSGQFRGLPVDGRRVTFSENVFYELHDRKIAQVWSTIDTAAIEAQLRAG
jgi:predicted ester cyclase